MTRYDWHPRDDGVGSDPKNWLCYYACRDLVLAIRTPIPADLAAQLTAAGIDLQLARAQEGWFTICGALPPPP